ncbi:MAG: PilZ domain-containing protein [Deltaproteobacteria bacterium]|nr:PilZ domain-containing protein [Deltaproteobacteria bacterium]
MSTSDERSGGSPPGNAQERRESPRIPVEMWVEESTERELYFQRSANLSVGGIFLENTIPHPKGTIVNLQFTLPGDTLPVKVRGEIVNAAASDELGMGIKFVDVDPEVERRISEFVQRAETARR